MLRRILPVVVASIAARFGVAQTPDTSACGRVDRIFAAYDRTDSPGCAVGVFRDGRVARGIQFNFTREKGKPNGFTVDAGRTKNLRFDRTK